MSKPAKNVVKVISECAEVVGSYEQESFHMNTYFEAFEYLQSNNGNISPIEQILYVAIKAVFHIMTVSPSEPDYDRHGNGILGLGYSLESQAKIGKYSVDFLIGIVCHEDRQRITKQVVVECDGHAFHDKDKHQRAYEKARDRFLQKEGYPVLHFTGSDIVANPVMAAAEVVSFLCSDTIDEIIGTYENFSGEEVPRNG
jgi:very-short-patch-repair endonuclease